METAINSTATQNIKPQTIFTEAICHFTEQNNYRQELILDPALENISQMRFFYGLSPFSNTIKATLYYYKANADPYNY